jgi:hypothetical protein
MRLLPLLLAVVAGVAAAQRTNDPGEFSGQQPQRSSESESDRRDRPESGVKLPAWPKNENLLEFRASSLSSFRFFIDAASLSVEPDRVVRYTLVARSGSGVTNISYEGMRCDSGTVKTYAYGQDGRWNVRESEWRDIEVGRWHSELRAGYLCVNRTAAIFSAKDGLDALRRGHNPGVPGPNRLNY